MGIKQPTNLCVTHTIRDHQLTFSSTFFYKSTSESIIIQKHEKLYNPRTKRQHNNSTIIIIITAKVINPVYIAYTTDPFSAGRKSY